MGLHRNSDENNKHTPKGFTSAGNMNRLLRDENGLSRYTPENHLPNVINFVDGNAAPPTEVSGDIYVIIDTGGGAENAAWDGATYNDWVRFNGALWVNYTPLDGDIVFDATAEIYKKYNSPDWEDFGVPSDSIYTASGTVPTSIVATLTDTLSFEGGQVTIEGANILETSKALFVTDGDTTPNALLDIRNNGQIGYGGAYLSTAGHCFRNPNNEATIAEFQHQNGIESVLINTDGAIATYNTAGTLSHRIRQQSGVGYLEGWNGSGVKYMEFQSGGSGFYGQRININDTVAANAKAVFQLNQSNAVVSQQLFFANITTSTAGRTGSSASFGSAEKGFECFDTDLNKKFVWNGSAWEQITSA